MQENNSSITGHPENLLYNAGMGRKLTKPRPKLGAHLMALRVNAGLSQGELAQRIGVPQQTIAFWEQSDKPPRSEVLPPIAEALGVKVEALLAPDEKIAAKRNGGGPKGKMKRLFEEASGLPRSQQDKIAEFVSAFVNQYRQTHTR
jgi:transcriptional regulator with XRE-family HTH domain